MGRFVHLYLRGGTTIADEQAEGEDQRRGRQQPSDHLFEVLVPLRRWLLVVCAGLCHESIQGDRQQKSATGSSRMKRYSEPRERPSTKVTFIYDKDFETVDASIPDVHRSLAFLIFRDEHEMTVNSDDPQAVERQGAAKLQGSAATHPNLRVAT